jgi:hypothetical protein
VDGHEPNPPTPAKLRGIATPTFAPVLLTAIAGWGVLVTSVVGTLVLSGEKDPDKRAIMKMGIGLILIWCVVGGLAMYAARDRFVEWTRRIPVGWRTRFIVLCIVFASLEEAVTTSLTNMAPLLGGVTDAAAITASKNYLVVVLKHSVIVFVPWFICWAWLLSRYDFRPAEVMLLFGFTGTFAETITFGLQNLAGAGMWTYVYGLMIYLPAATVPEQRGARSARWWTWPMAVLLPVVFAVPLAFWLVWKAATAGWGWAAAWIGGSSRRRG